MAHASERMEKYFADIDNEVKRAFSIASNARKKGFDPELNVEIKLARNMAERVEGLISSVAPGLVGSGMTKRIIELEEKYSPLDWRVALIIGEEVAKEKFCKFKDKKEAMEVGIRAGFAYHTSGIVAAPLEGFVELRIKKRKDGKEYFAPSYAGPIRGAGGTASSFSLILTDYVRTKMGYSKWDPTEDEIGRLKTEINDYHERVTNLQYLPSDEELDFLLRNIPIEISGEPTEKFDVSNHKDIDRIGTNRIRGGVCLVLAEGLSQKAPKLWKRLEKWGADFDLEWDFLKEFLEVKKKVHSKTETTSDNDVEKPKIAPNNTFIKDLVAGRPVLAFPMQTGGFRLRYGRSRITGFSAAAIHPATMVLLDGFIATGTQLKIERPGKAASMLPCESISGPIVKLESGNVVHVRSKAHAKQIKKEVEKIMFLGDILFNYGDFSENGHALVPCGYNEEIWVKELEKKAVNIFGEVDHDKIADLTGIDKDVIRTVFSDPLYDIKSGDALSFAEKMGVSLHPRLTYFWKLISRDDILRLREWLSDVNVKKEDGKIIKAILPKDDQCKSLLEKIGLPHLFVNNEFVVIEKDDALAFLLTLGHMKNTDVPEGETLDVLSRLSGFRIRDKAGIFIGARMGRPEKAKHRKMTGSPHTLFPVGEEGGRLRSFQSALDAGYVEADFVYNYCSSCKKDTVYLYCETCGKKTEKKLYCHACGSAVGKDGCKQHGGGNRYFRRRIDIKHYIDDALKRTGIRVMPNLVKGVRGTSNEDHVPEHLAKGILRAKYEVYVNKDGTIRYDMTELPMTHFKPSEIGTSIEKLKELGYEKDCKGDELTSPDQVVELLPHDLVLPGTKEALDEPSDAVLTRAAKFVDELLVTLYKEKPFYNIRNSSDLIGAYVIGLAPHISAGTVGRIIGFTNTQGFFAHPLMHAAFRRDCDGDEAAVMLLMDAFLNFSRQYLPNTRGAKTMDAPLVLTSRIIPTEVDDMVHGLDTVWSYPLEMYAAADEFRMPWEVKIDQVKNFLNTEKQYESYGFTHDIADVNAGIPCSSYKSLPSMQEKLDGQMRLAEKVMAVDESIVAQYVIEKHFLKDTKGNLRKFSMQQFRCIKCNEKFRRPPLIGKCTTCGGRIIFTISEGSVIKYLGLSIGLAEKYDVKRYLKQTLELLNQRVEDVFGKEKEKQEALGKWFRN